jgi:hypothetical protein
MDECEKRNQNVIIKTYGFSLKRLYLNSDFSSWGGGGGVYKNPLFIHEAGDLDCWWW